MSLELQRWGRAWLPLCFAVSTLLGCGENERPDDELHPVKAPEVARIMPAAEALTGAHVPTLDPATLHEAEIRKALEAGPRCEFRYTSTGKPVLAISLQAGGAALTGVIKLNGHLIVLKPVSDVKAGEPTERLSMLADPIRIRVMPDQRDRVVKRAQVRRWESNMIFEIGQRLKVGYRGFLDCTSEPPAISPRDTSGVGQ